MVGPILLVGGAYFAYHLIKAKNQKQKSAEEAAQGITLEEFLEDRR